MIGTTYRGGSDAAASDGLRNNTVQDKGNDMTTTGTITVQADVDQRECIKRGIAADSTVRVEIDLSTLTPAEREEMARRWDAGRVRTGGYFHAICPPDADGLRRALAAAAAGEAGEQAKRRADLAAVASEIRAGGFPYVSASQRADLPEDCRATLTRRDEEAAAASRVKSAAENERLAAARAKADAEREAKAARLQEQRRAFLASTACPGRLAERRAAGYATDNSVDYAIGSAERVARGVTHTGGLRKWEREDYDRVQTCNDEQFAALAEFRAKLPADADVSLYDMHNHGESGEAIERLLVADATWTVGEVTVAADCQIGTLPDEATQE